LAHSIKLEDGCIILTSQYEAEKSEEKPKDTSQKPVLEVKEGHFGLEKKEEEKSKRKRIEN